MSVTNKGPRLVYLVQVHNSNTAQLTFDQKGEIAETLEFDETRTHWRPKYRDPNFSVVPEWRKIGETFRPLQLGYNECQVVGVFDLSGEDIDQLNSMISSALAFSTRNAGFADYDKD